MFKAIKRLITSGLKPHSCKLCYNCYVCHGCLHEKNQIRQCCYGVTEEELDILHEELKNNFSLIYPVRKHSIGANENSTETKNDDDDSINCCKNFRHQSNFRCDICGHSFKKEYTLTRHFNAHDKAGEKFKCQTCRKCFAYSKDLQKHSKLHKDVEKKSRVCKFCEKQFSSVNYLKIHMRRHNIRPFRCEICSDGFETQSMLNIHYQTHVTKRIPCHDSLNKVSTDSEVNEKNDVSDIKRTTCDDSLKNASSDSELEILEEKKDNFNEKNSDLENFDHEESNSGKSENQDFTSNLSDQFNMEDDLDNDENQQKNFQISLEKYLNLTYSSESNIEKDKSYKAPLVIKLKPSE